jgi:chaperonin GroES
LHDRVLVKLDKEAGERRSGAGIVIPATAALGKRLSWGEVVAASVRSARSVKLGDRVLFDPEDKAEVELHGVSYTLLRERDLHAIAAERLCRPRAPAFTSDRPKIRGNLRRRPCFRRFPRHFGGWRAGGALGGTRH